MSSPAYQNLTVLSPKSLDSLQPIEIIDDSSPIRAAFVERGGIEQLPESWKEACGYYVLFSHIHSDNTFEAYVGKASNGFYNRLRSHDKDKPWWRTALMVFKDREPGFSSTQSAYMEGKIREILESWTNVTVHNIAATGDRTLPSWEEGAMETIALSTLRIMHLRGYRNSQMAPAAVEPAARSLDSEPARERSEEAKPSGRHRAEEPEAAPTSAPKSPAAPAGLEGGVLSAEGEERFGRLRVWRLGVARGNGWPAYAVMHDAALRGIAQTNPQKLSDLQGIPRVTPKKVDLYGADILRLLGTSD